MTRTRVLRDPRRLWAAGVMLLGGLVNPGGYTVMWLADLRIARLGWSDLELMDVLVFMVAYTLPCLIMTGTALWQFREGRAARPLGASI